MTDPLSTTPEAPEGWTKKRFTGLPGVQYTLGGYRVVYTNFSDTLVVSLTSMDELTVEEANELLTAFGLEVLHTGLPCPPCATTFVLA